MAQSSPPLPDERLPFVTKLIYGLGDWGNTTTSTIFLFFFAFYLTDIARLDPLYAAPVLLVGGIWDAINDPLIGILADRVQTRWGRRRPFFLFGALPLAICFVFLWWVPPITSQVGKAVYYLVAYLLFDTVYTAVNVPYSALTPELTEDYDERTHLSGFRMAVSMAGGLIAAVAVPVLADAFPEKKTGYLVMALIFGALAALPYLMLFFRVRERHVHVERAEMSLSESIRHTFRNRPFRYAAAIYMFTWMTVNLIASMMQYFLTYYMHMADQLEIVLGVVQAAALVFIPVMVWLSGRAGKQRAFIIGAASLAVVMAALSFLPPEMQTLAYILGLCAGFGIAAAHVIPWSIVPDVIEQDELETGRRREGTFYGFMVFLQKTGTAVTLAAVQEVLHFTGYLPGAVQSPQVLTAIRVLFGFLPALLLIPAMILAWRFPINRAQHEELRRALALKRSAEDS